MNQSAHALSQLFTDGRRLTYERGDMIIRAGDLPSGVYYIASGWVKLYSICNDGELNIIMTLFPGDIFPLTWAVTGTLRDFNFAALDTTNVLRIPREQLARAMQADRSVARAALGMLAQHSIRLTDEIENLHYSSARERVAFRLISLAGRFGKLNHGQITIDARISNEYVARSTNMTRETVSRQITRLTEKNLIRNVDGCIVIPDLPALKNEVSKYFDLSTASPQQA